MRRPYTEIIGRMTKQFTSLIQSTQSKTFLSGPPGSGKTTLAVERLRWLIQRGMPTTSLLVLVPQRTLDTPYYTALHDPQLGPAGAVDVVTLDGLARRIIGLFWPLISEQAGFAHPNAEPVFLTVETAQFFMDDIVSPLIDQQGYFDAVTIGRTRLLSQLLDNLNKASLIGIPLADVPERLKTAWTGESAHQRVFDQGGECVQRFRRYCMDHNLLDFSLQMETFLHHLWPQPAVRAYLFERYRHLIVDNVEEDTPVVHDLLAEWVAHCDSALIAFDSDGGYRVFLGADPSSAARLADACDERITLTESHVASPDVLHLSYQLGLSLDQIPPPVEGDFRRAMQFQQHRFHPQMLDWVVDETARLIDEGTPPGEIVVLAPFVSDALRFSLIEKLAARQVPAHSHRPSRALRDEPAARCLLTWAKLAHPAWGLLPPAFDVVLALVQSTWGLDLVRARLLADVVYRPRISDSESQIPNLSLGAFAQIQDDMRSRIGYLAGERYDALRGWIEAYVQSGEEAPLDHFFSRLFGEVLSQPGFGFHTDGLPASSEGQSGSVLDAGRVAADLIESARKFRGALERVPHVEGEAQTPIGARFVQMVEHGVVAATYVQSWQLTQADAVLVAPAYTYLMTNHPVDYQFWINAGSNGWWERIYQPLTHPYVLRRDWKPGRPWTDDDEHRVQQESLYRLLLGLTRRCRQGVFLGISELGEQGYEQRGPLLKAIQSALRRVAD